ncbi:MAG: metallophosphoesterase [archaeon]
MHRKNLCLISLFFLLTSCSNDLTIGIIGDQFGAINADSSYAVLNLAVDKMNTRKPDIVLHVGDLVESIQNINSVDDYNLRFDQAVKIMNRLQAPWLLAIGDHDVDPPFYEALSTDRSRENWFLEQSNSYGLANKGKLFYSYDIEGYHFTVLYSLENLHTDPRWGSIFLNQISAEQMNWLANDLEENKNASGIIVLVHHPHWYVWQNWSKVHDLLKQYPVAVVIAGHYHYDQDDGELDGIRYLTIGATGGVLKTADANSGGSPQYALMTLNGRKIQSLQLRDVRTDNEIELTPRQSMDRIQALSCMLGNLYQDETIYSQKNDLVTSGDKIKWQHLDMIGLESLCNPIDLPIQIKVGYDPNILFEPKWTDSDINSDCEITLKPGERTGWANYSSVGQWFKPQPLWTAKVNTKNVLASQSITLDISVRFNDGRERTISNKISFPVMEKLKK